MFIYGLFGGMRLCSVSISTHEEIEEDELSLHLKCSPVLRGGTTAGAKGDFCGYLQAAREGANPLFFFALR